MEKVFTIIQANQSAFLLTDPLSLLGLHIMMAMEYLVVK